MRWRSSEGWRATEVAYQGDPAGGSSAHHWSNDHQEVIRAGASAYFRELGTPAHEAGFCADIPARVSDLVHETTLLRLHPCGEVIPVLHLPALAAGGCEWHGLPDGSVRIDCRRPERSLLLRWNEALLRLEPEGPAFPNAPLERLCRPARE